MIQRSAISGQRLTCSPAHPLTHSPPPRRGLASVAIVIVLLLCMLFIVGLVYGSAREQDLSLSRVESIRALYAAESGANMAIRELMLNADEDGDGNIGTISDDGDPATNPQLHATHFNVESEADETLITLTSRGHSGRATRAVQIVLDAAAGGTDEIAMVAYGRAGSTQPGYRIWNDDAWGDEQLASDVDSIPRWLVLRGSPASSQFALATLDQANAVNVQLWNGSSWGMPFTAAPNMHMNEIRAFDMAYEQQSGRILFVYRHAAVGMGRYRVYDGTVWYGQSHMPSEFDRGLAWMKLAPRQESNELLAVAQRDRAPGAGNAEPIAATLWNGEQFVHPIILSGDSGPIDYQHADAAFEGTSGNAMVVYSDGETTPRYRTLVDGVWSAQLSLPDLGEEPHWMRLVANPMSDEIVLGVLDAGDRLHANVWNGSSWGAFVEVAQEAGGADRRGFDVAFAMESNAALLTYHTGGSAVMYRIWDGESWSIEESGPTASGSLPSVVGTIQARPGVEDGEAFVTWVTDSGAIRTAFWDGSAFSDPVTLTATGSAPMEYETFMIDTAPAGVVIIAWSEAAPR